MSGGLRKQLSLRPQSSFEQAARVSPAPPGPGPRGATLRPHAYSQLVGSVCAPTANEIIILFLVNSFLEVAIGSEVQLKPPVT